MPDNKIKLPRSNTALCMDRAEAIKFKLMPDGHIRVFQSDTPDLRGASKSHVYVPSCTAPTLIAARAPNS